MNVFGIGLPEMAVIAAIGLLVFGPRRLPELGKTLGRTLKGFQSASQEFEKEFRNSLTSLEIGYDTRRGRSVFVEFGQGVNFDSDLSLATFGTQLRLSRAWNLTYEATWLELDPDPELESTWIHVLRSSYYLTNDFFVSLFAQSNSAISKENVQALLVWRFRPPFGALQVAYQRGTSELGRPSEQGDTLFTKLSWVF